MRVLFYILFFLAVGCKNSSEDTRLDNSKSDSAKIYLDKISSESLSIVEKINLNNKAFSQIDLDNVDSINRVKLFSIANNYFNLDSNGSRFFKTSKIILASANKAKDTSALAKANVYIAEYYKSIKANDSALLYYVRAEKFYKKSKDFANLADVFVRKADLQAIENDFFGSEKSSLEALSFLRLHPNAVKEYEAYNLIGISSNELGSYQKAIEYFNKALLTTDDLGLESKAYYRAISLNNLGNAYQNFGDYTQAIKYYNLALAEGIEKDYSHLYAILLDNLAYSQFKRGEKSDLSILFYKSLKLHEELGMTSKVVLVNIHLSEYFFKMKEYDKSLKHAQAALMTAKIERFPGDVLASLKQLAIVDAQNSAKLSNEYIRINDSIRKEERQMEDKFARIQFETDEIALQKEQLAEQNRTLLYFFAGTMFIGVLLFVIRNQRAKNRELLLKQSQQKANEDIYNLMISQQNKIDESRIKEKKRIAQELHDGVLGRLFGARLNLDSLNRHTDPDAIQNRVKYLGELKKIEEDIRTISHDLNREKYVLINNFLAILTNLLEEQQYLFGQKLDVQISEDIKWDELDNILKINIYRIIQECLQNINKYAQANLIKIRINLSQGGIGLQVADDGIGFNVNAQKKGIGLQNIVIRTQELDGSIDIKSKRGRGTQIFITFPLLIKASKLENLTLTTEKM